MRVEVSSHAVDRYVQRVDSHASRQEARLAVMQIASLGRLRAVPRHWLRRHVQPCCGLLFLTWNHRPEICLLVRDGVVVTVITRAMCEGRARLAEAPSASRRRVPDTARWRWNGAIDTDEVA
jgi:hypothetical protein